MLDPTSLFNESYYLSHNPDVMATVSAGILTSGLEHFMEAGQFENRQPSAWFEPDFYLALYPDVKMAVSTGETTALQHFIAAGQFENRDPITEFFTDIYLDRNPDIATAVTADLLTAYEHFVKSGQQEGRSPGPDFDATFYLNHHPDVAAFVKTGQLSAVEHYLLFGASEGRAATENTSPLALNETLELGVLSTRNLTGATSPDTSPQRYRFRVDSPSQVSLLLSRLSDDIQVTLYQDHNDNRVFDFTEAIAVDTEPGTQAKLLNRVLNPGDYSLAIAAQNGETSYHLSLSTVPLSQSYPNLTENQELYPQNLGSLSSEILLRDFLEPNQSADIYQFTLETTTPVQIELKGLTADVDLFLVQESPETAEILAESTTPGNQPETITHSALEAGTYSIWVKPVEGETPYDLSLFPDISPESDTRTLDLPPPMFDPNFGFGLVDAGAAVARVLGESTPFPQVPNPIVNNYALDMINVPAVWDRGYSGEGVVVAVLDTGIDLTHRDLQGNLWVNVGEIPGNGLDNDGNGFIDDFHGYDFVDGNGNPSFSYSTERHATHLAGIIGAQRNGIDGTFNGGIPFDVTGVAYNATLMPVRVLDDRQSFDQFEIAVANGIRYAVNNGAQVLNLSLGNLPGEPPTERIAEALRFARDRGVVAVFASGNEGAARATQPADPAIRAAEGLGIAVGAVDRDRRVAPFSNPAGSALGSYPFLVAPGVGIRSTTPNQNYFTLDGTSMSAPYLSGVVALMLQANPYLTPAEVERILIETANPSSVSV
ncbi:S8 family serine peptidase [Oscillatoria acuminata]|uniref:Subtilisin-like serine protease n=1 Tax=Oscillatoria acuminata PCC 6304 TaxID=56110 RepID=K9TQT2_9CYAN|nr:S8 family serine peptidase [Oscillatoria acuminata]AFY85212.1 subtilisin-like serine protease [Oscillatoria acuminata PCC 6304]